MIFSCSDANMDFIFFPEMKSVFDRSADERVSLLPSTGQTLYGRVLWNPEQNLNAAYKLQLEKVYLCTGRDGYVPFFDPTGTLYNEGPQYGCIQPNKHLKHRFLLLVGETQSDSLDITAPVQPVQHPLQPVMLHFYCFQWHSSLM